MAAPAYLDAPDSMDRLWPRAQALAQALPRFLPSADRRVAPVGRGSHGRRRAGAGDAFWQFREFQPGDTRSDIDWRRSARSQRLLFVRQTEWEAQQTLWLWCDRSASMGYRGGADTTKLDRALTLVLAAGHLAAEAGERLAVADGRSRPAQGRFGALRLRESLARHPVTALPDLRLIRPRQHLVVVSDFLWEEQVLRRFLVQAAAARARLHLVQILSPAEMRFPFKGRLRMVGLEGEADDLVERGEDLAEAYNSARAVWQRQLQDLARDLDASFLTHRTDRPAAYALLALARVLEAEAR